MAEQRPVGGPGGSVRAIVDIVAALRRIHDTLGLDVCFIREIPGKRRVIRFVEGELETAPLTRLALDPRDPAYCRQVFEAILPEQVEVAAAGDGEEYSYVGIPVELPDGTVEGVFCVLGSEVGRPLDDRDIAVVRMLAGIVTDHLTPVAPPMRATIATRRSTIEAVLSNPVLPRILLQPIVSLAEGSVVGFEALARFDHGRPDLVFEDAWSIGLGVALETKAIEATLALLPRLPAGTFVAMNVSPETMRTERFLHVLGRVDPKRVVLEITEEQAVENTGAVAVALLELRARGVRLAVDDVGAGYADLTQLEELHPDLLKLDTAFTNGVDHDAVRRALTSALVTFGQRIEASVVVEGVESVSEFETMRRLGVQMGQGFFIGAPVGIDAIVATMPQP